MKRRIYLDNAAAHPVRPSARRVFLRALSSFGNPSAPHTEGRAAADILEKARAVIARALGAKNDAVIFTSGATESNALAIVGYVKARIARGVKASTLRVLYSAAQHASSIGAVREVQRLGVNTVEIPLVEGGIDLNALAELLKEETALVTIDAVCGETGTRFDTRGMRKRIDALPAGNRPILHVDATQAVLVENIERTRLGADLISFDAQKIGGVRGIGVLIAPRAVQLLPLVEGGGQERGVRSGTQSPALAAAFASALLEAARERALFTARAKRMSELLIEEIRKLFPKALVNGGGERAPHILNVSFPGVDTDYVAALLDEAGVAVATRSACETDATGSRVVLALSGDSMCASSTLRVSFSSRTTMRDIRVCTRSLAQTLLFLGGAAR